MVDVVSLGMVCGGLVLCPPAASVYADGTDVGRAMLICNQHLQYPVSVYPEGHTPWEYHEGWEACYKVRQKWEASEAARHLKELELQERRDKDFVESVAKDQ